MKFGCEGCKHIHCLNSNKPCVTCLNRRVFEDYDEEDIMNFIKKGYAENYEADEK